MRLPVRSFLVGLAVALLLVPVRHASAQGDCPSCYDLETTPDGQGVATAFNTRDTVEFIVTNVGSLAVNATFTCSSTGGVSCVSVSPTSATIQPDLFKKVKVIYDLGSTLGEVRLTASGGDTDMGSFVVSAEPTVTLVVPILTSGSRAVVRNRQPVVRALFLPNGSGIDTTKTTLILRSDTVTTLARHNRGLIEWEVDSARWIPVGDSALVTVKACAVNGLCTTVTRYAVLPNDSKPVLGFSGMPLEALGRQFSAPFGPGLSVSGADVETGIATPAYVSMGVARTAGLVYSTRQAYPRALVPIDLELTWPAGTPDDIKVILQDGAVKLDSLVVSSPTCATGAARRCRLVLEGDFSGSTFSTPTRKWLSVEARVTSSGTTHSATDSVEVVLVDRRSTPYGAGWWPTGVLKLVQAGSDRLLIGPSGAASVYRGNGDSLYLSPPGDFTVLTRGAGGGLELRRRGSGAKLEFDSYGRLWKAADANGNGTTIQYSGTSDQVTTIYDPLNKTFTFAYASGVLSTITDPGSRQTKVTIDGGTNQLTYDSLPSSTSKPYTTRFAYQAYPGTNTNVLTKWIGVIGDTTVVTYDSTFKRRPSQVTLPRVEDESGLAVTPVVAYTAVERQGFGSLRSLDSAYVELKDARNNFTRSLVNRWGQARKTWDALGTLGQANYTAEGFTLWAESKTGDSSRVYHTYDALRRLARSYIVRSSSDTLRLDSLVYDANHRVTQRIDSRGKVWRAYYDATGNVIAAVVT